MKRRILIGCFTLLFVVLYFNTKAQGNQKLTYFKIDKLTVESFKSWTKSFGSQENVKLPYVCLPAKIVGIDKDRNSKSLEALNSYFKNVKQIEMKDEEALKLCSTTRKL